jgi:hypothetical protein
MPKENPIGNDDWEAQEDVRTMARAHAIKKDPARHKRMKHHAKKMLSESMSRKHEADQMVKMGQE